MTLHPHTHTSTAAAYSSLSQSTILWKEIYFMFLCVDVRLLLLARMSLENGHRKRVERWKVIEILYETIHGRTFHFYRSLDGAHENLNKASCFDFIVATKRSIFGREATQLMNFQHQTLINELSETTETRADEDARQLIADKSFVVSSGENFPLPRRFPFSEIFLPACCKITFSKGH